MTKEAIKVDCGVCIGTGQAGPTDGACPVCEGRGYFTPSPEMPGCVRLARERLSMFVNDEVPISARDLREMLSAVVVEYEALFQHLDVSSERPENVKKEMLMRAPANLSPAVEALTNAAITVHVCGGRQARICQKTGKEHDMSMVIRFTDGGASVACKDCGVSAMQIDMMELP